MRLFFAAFCLLICFALPAQAQENTGSSSGMPMSDPTPKQMREARNFLNQCRLNEEMNARHNCQCMTLQFLEKRVMRGDKVKASAILSELRNTCLKNEQKDIKSLGYKDLSEVPQDVIDEAQSVHDNCLKDMSLSAYKDCGCIAGKFIEDRMRLGPAASQNNILASYEGTCYSMVQIAGGSYTKCMEERALYVPDRFKPRNYCECFSSEYTKAFGSLVEKPGPNTFSSIAGLAMNNCSRKLETDKKAWSNP